MRLGKNYHIIHMTDDQKGLGAWYQSVFSTYQFMAPGYYDVEKRDASLIALGDLAVEPLAPAFTVPGWEEAPLGRFFRRFGRRWHSLSWYVDEGIGDLHRRLVEAGVRVVGAAGGDVVSAGVERPIFTHPRDTGTQLEFCPTRQWAPGEELFMDPRLHGSFDLGWWTNHHPLHLLKWSHVTLTTSDPERLASLYERTLDGRRLTEVKVDLNESLSIFVAVGDTVIELAQPLAGGPLADDVAAHGESLYSLTFKVADLDGAREYLASKGVTPTRSDDRTMIADPETTGGAVMAFTTASIDGDDRPDWGQPRIA